MLLLVAAAPARAFHEHGVAQCATCHVMHGERDGEVVLDGSAPLLVAASATDVCLACHGGATGVFASNPLAPPHERGAGNFVFLLEDNLNDAPGGQFDPIAGEAAGHSVVSIDRGTHADSRWTHAPGGNFPSAALGCTSCHDPHGNQNFRFLHGAGPVQGGLYSFTDPAPDADGLECCGSGVSETPAAHTAYRDGMSRWCGNCHGDYHRHDSSAFDHFGDHALGHTAHTYNNYDGHANSAGGSPATAYLPEVPFEDPDTSVDATAGPMGASRLMCLTCHRAHASSAPAAGRWDFAVEFLDQDGAISGSYPLPNPYGDPRQGSLCAKCHHAQPYERFQRHQAE